MAISKVNETVKNRMKERVNGNGNGKGNRNSNGNGNIFEYPDNHNGHDEHKEHSKNNGKNSNTDINPTTNNNNGNDNDNNSNNSNDRHTCDSEVGTIEIEGTERTTPKSSGNVPQRNNPSNTLWGYINSRKEAISKALPKHMTPERMGMIAYTEIRRNPKLLQCTPQSLFGAIMQASQLGVEPGPLGQCYLVPFWNKKAGTYDVQFILGYKGMIDLARRSGNIESIYAHAVMENDSFEYSYGLNPTLNHKPALKDRGNIIGFYAVVHFRDGGNQFEYMSIDEVEKRRERSKAADSGPWTSDYEEMGKKTILRHMWKYLPVSVEVMKQTVLDETVTDIEKPDLPLSVYEIDGKENTAA